MWVAAAVAIVGTIVSTISDVQQAGAEADQNEALAKQEIQAARHEEFVDRRKSDQIIAKQQAGAAAAGLDISSGTPLELLMNSAFNAELNALKIRKQGQYRAAFYK